MCKLEKGPKDETNQPQVEIAKFVIDETPYGCWEWGIRTRNLEFLCGIDPGYYSYVADSNAEHLDDEEHRHRAALAIRSAYSQGLETLFALIGAFVQAPECVFGWLLRYRVSDLTSLTRKLTEGLAVRNALTMQPTLHNISRSVHAYLPFEDEKKEWLVEGFERAWRRFAGEFLNVEVSAEYNSAKHGLRTRLGGFTLK